MFTRGTRSRSTNSRSIIKGVKRESTVLKELVAGSILLGMEKKTKERAGRRGSGPPPRWAYFSIRESWIESSSRCSTKCQEISLTTIFKKVCLKAARLVPESIGSGPRFGNRLFRVSVVDVVGFLGLILDRLVLAVLGIIKLEYLDMDLGFAVHHVQVAGSLRLELLDFEEDGHVGPEITHRRRRGRSSAGELRPRSRSCTARRW